MWFHRDLKDNLIISRPYIGRRWPLRVALIIILFVLLGVVAVIYKPHCARLRNAVKEKRQVAEVEKEPVSVDQGMGLLSQMRRLIDENKPIQAREKGYEVLQRSKDLEVLQEAENILTTLNIDLLLTPHSMPEKETYIVRQGDTLEKLAKKFGTTVELIQKSNGISDNIIHIGDRLTIFKGKFSIVISKRHNDLTLYMENRFFKRYSVGTGKHGTTPAGTFTISDKIVNPPWWRPDGKVLPFGDKENVLGTRWMTITAAEGTAPVRGYGIHGTWDEKTIGGQTSGGCVRLTNADVEELFMMVPIGTSVVITE